MLYAEDNNEERIDPFPGGKAICPICKDTVMAKCGVINAWHWAHINKGECDPWAENESEWHLSWKRLFPKANTEVPVWDVFLNMHHRADIRLNDGTVVELQHSSISVGEIIVRQRVYKKTIWVFDVKEAYDNKHFDFRLKQGSTFTFRWRWPVKHIAHASQVCLDLGDGYVFILQKMYPDTPTAGGVIYGKSKSF